MSFEEDVVERLPGPRTPNTLGRLGEYHIQSCLGEGGMAVVFQAWDGTLNRPVAIKVLPPQLASNPNFRTRFIREAQSMARLNCDYVVPIHRVVEGLENCDLPFIVMPLLRGETLEARLARLGPLDFNDFSLLLCGTCAGLLEAHENNIIHRDVKPSNIWLELPRSSVADLQATVSFRVKLLDFGIARPANAAQLTGSSQFIGSVMYSSPEQLNCQELDHRTDIFSLGVVLVEALTGKHPFRTDPAMSDSELRRAIREKRLPMLMQLVPDYPDLEIARIIDTMLSKQPQDRPYTLKRLLRPLFESTAIFGEFIDGGKSKGTGSLTVKTGKEKVSPPTVVPPPILQKQTPEGPGSFANTIVTQPGSRHRLFMMIALITGVLNCLILAILILEAFGLIPKLPTRQ